MLEVEAGDKVHKRPHFEPSSPRFCKRLGKELSVSGPSVVGEAGKTLGSTSETVTENYNDAAMESAPSSSLSAKMDTIALCSEDATGQERSKLADRLHWEDTNLNASPPGEADGQDESMPQHSDSTDWPYGTLNERPAVSTCSSNFDSHAGIREMNINR